jgi:hypothetical protein
VVKGYLLLRTWIINFEAIHKAGLEAEAVNLAQSQAKSEGKSATVDVLASFASLQKEYKSVMGVVNAVKAEIARNEESSDLLTKLEGILINEAELSVKTIEEETPEGVTQKKRKVRRSASQEALRAEIAKDAGALIDLTEVHDRLAERRVTPERLSTLLESAKSLSESLANRATAKGAGKTATQIEREACALQRDIWGA